MSILDKDLQFREIITKAACGYGRRYITAKHLIPSQQKPTSILGCWIINHTYEAHKSEDAIVIKGTYDANIWFSHSQHSKTEVAKESISFVEHIQLSYLDHNMSESAHVEVKINVVQAPNCVEAKVENGMISIAVESEYLAEIIGETKLCVLVNPHGCQVDMKSFTPFTEEDTNFADEEDFIDEMD